jgi:hypothetical protein
MKFRRNTEQRNSHEGHVLPELNRGQIDFIAREATKVIKELSHSPEEVTATAASVIKMGQEGGQDALRSPALLGGNLLKPADDYGNTVEDVALLAAGRHIRGLVNDRNLQFANPTRQGQFGFGSSTREASAALTLEGIKLGEAFRTFAEHQGGEIDYDSLNQRIIDKTTEVTGDPEWALTLGNAEDPLAPTDLERSAGQEELLDLMTYYQACASAVDMPHAA